MRYRDVDYRTLYNVLRKRYDRTENTIANLENLKSIHENEILNLKEKLRTKDIEHVATQAQRDAAEKRADQLMRAIHDMSSANSGTFFFVVVVAGLSQSCELNMQQVVPSMGEVRSNTTTRTLPRRRQIKFWRI